MEVPMQTIKTKPDFPKCTYNAGVCCHPVVKKCDNCGWNPAVEKARNAKIKNICVEIKKISHFLFLINAP